MFVRLLAGYRVHISATTGSKVTRATPLASQVNAGNVSAIKAEWTREWLEELRSFPSGRHADQVDATADAFLRLALGPGIAAVDVSRPAAGDELRGRGPGLYVGRRGASGIARRA
jgi:hypothetical protein